MVGELAGPSTITSQKQHFAASGFNEKFTAHLDGNKLMRSTGAVLSIMHKGNFGASYQKLYAFCTTWFPFQSGTFRSTRPRTFTKNF